jgi:peptidyl-prolyl cis-trans isomerase A (cyclophilin A)
MERTRRPQRRLPGACSLDKENAPISTENFVNYANSGKYDGTIFHRVIDDFMIQGGGLEPDLDKRPTDAPIKNEWQNGLSNMRGTVAMARLSNQPDSATTQFFINVADNDFLDTPRDGAGYAVFAKVVEGMGVVDAIKGVPTTTRSGMRDVPVDPIIIESVKPPPPAAPARPSTASRSAPEDPSGRPRTLMS